MPRLTTWAPFLFAQWFCPCGQCYHQKVFKTITWLPLTRLQGNKPHRNSPEPSEPCLRYLHQRTPELTHRNSLEPPAHTGTLRNLPPELTSAHTGTLRNLPEPASGTCSCDSHRNTPELIWAEDPFSLRCWGKIYFCYIICSTSWSPRVGGTSAHAPPSPGQFCCP